MGHVLPSFFLTAQPKAGAVHGFASVYFYLFFLVLSVSRPKLPLGQLPSPDDVTIRQLQATPQLFSSYPPSEAFCQVSKLKEHCHRSFAVFSFIRR